MKIVSFLVFFALAALAAAIAGDIAPGEWYSHLNKPSWTPPNSIFTVGWPVIYMLMVVAAYQVWQERHPLSPRAIGWWLVLLMLNIAWSWLFFGWHSPGLALMEMSVLLIALSAAIRVFRRVKLSAATMLTPYLVWVSMVWIFTFAIWWMNGAGLKIREFFH